MHLRKSANAPWKRRLRSAIKKDWRPRALHFKRGYVLLWEAETITFQMQPEAAILSAKSGISNHAASNIPDHLCFSKFGTSPGVCPQTTDIFRTFVCAPSWHRQTEHNRAKPLSESASALFSIADAGEFGSRGFILSVKRCH